MSSHDRYGASMDGAVGQGVSLYGLLLTPTVDHLFDRGFTEGQRRYLEFHREALFLEARVQRQ